MGLEEKGEEEEESPLVASFYISNDDSKELTHRTGTIWTAMAHIITGVIGAGVLSLAWSTAQLGWIAGPVAMILFAAITLVPTFLLCDCYRSPPAGADSDCGPALRHSSFMQAVHFYLGKKSQWICGVFFHESLFGGGVAYTITTATSIRAILKSTCYHNEGHAAPCEYGDSSYMLLFGLVQIFMSQIPDFHSMAWLSIIAAVMSFAYAAIGLGLGFATAIENTEIKGSMGGVPADSIADKLWLAFQALGDIAFAYPYTVFIFEIQDTLKSTPPETQTMKKASTASTLITTFFYLCCGCFGYAAFGNNTPGNLIAGFGFYEPYWLVGLANACVVLHLVGGYQLISQPVFAFVERWFHEKFPGSGYMNKLYGFKLPLVPVFQFNPFRLCFRTGYVVLTTGVALMFPYFNQVLGVLGALNFWPLAIYFPVEMYFVQMKIRTWTKKWVVLQTFSIVGLIVSFVALIGSVQGLIQAKLS